MDYLKIELFSSELVFGSQNRKMAPLRAKTFSLEISHIRREQNEILGWFKNLKMLTYLNNKKNAPKKFLKWGLKQITSKSVFVFDFF